MTDHLRQAKAEMSAAEAAIANMKSATSMEQFEAKWREFLTCLEKVWTKTERSCTPHRSKFEPWQGQFHRLRKKDMLLRYLKNARDADNHTIQDLAELKPGYTSYSLAGGGGYVEYMHLDSQKGLVEYRGDPMIETVVPPKPEALKFEVSGQWFNPPTSHMGKLVSSQHPVVLAELGLAFYADFVSQVEEKFFK